MKKLSYILLCGLMLILSACEKDTESFNFAPVVTTGTASNIYRMGATLSGSITLTETNTAKEYGILFSELESMAEYDEYPVKDGSTSYSVLIQNLEPGETYYYCAYASSGYSIAKSQIKSFTTTQSNAPVFNEVVLQSKDEKSCAVSTELLDDGGSELLMTGFVWSEAGSGEPTIKSNVVNVELQGSRMSATIKGMEPNKTYLVRAYGVNAQGVGYSNSIRVTTSTATVPVLSDIIAPDSTEVSVTVRSSIVDAGLGEVTKVGFCYSSESKNPTTDHLVVEEIHGSPESEYFAAIIEGLKPETTYYIRAYAINEKGTGYSETFVYATPEPTLIEGNEGDVDVVEAGGLSKFIDDTNKYNITKLKVSGYLNGDDIRLIREMAGRDVNGNETPGRLVDLDISEATITWGDGYYLIYDWVGYGFQTSTHEIGQYMFQGTILKNIYLPLNSTIIAQRAFENCDNLEKISIPEGVIAIGNAAFASCDKLRSVKLPENLSVLDTEVFVDCISLSEIEIPSKVNYIPWSGFQNCTSLTRVVISEGNTIIGANAFKNCSSLSDITIPNSINEIDQEAFWDCSSLTSINLPEGLTSIGTYAFCSCSSLSSVNIPNSITTLENGIFRACSSLTNILIPETVTAIGTQAFYECTSLVEIICKATTPPEFPTGHPVFGTYELNYIPSSVLYVPAGCASAYKNSEWNGYFSAIKAEGETDSGEGSFDDMPNIEW